MADKASQPSDHAEDVGAIEAAAEAPVIAERIQAALQAVVADYDLVGELARAMHEAATSQYERLNGELDRRRSELVEAITARASLEMASLKAASEADIGAIDSWAKAETNKIKVERLRRVDARGVRLAHQVDRPEAIKGREVFAIEATIESHRNEIDRFFGLMERETDPTAIARVASMLPPFPPLAEIAEEARRAAVAEFAGLDAQVEATPATDDFDTIVPVSQSRLMAVMDPVATSRNPDAGDARRPWEVAPHAVAVVAGPRFQDETWDDARDEDSHVALEPELVPELVPEPVPAARTGTRLLRTVPAIRPVVALRDHEDRLSGA